MSEFRFLAELETNLPQIIKAAQECGEVKKQNEKLVEEKEKLEKEKETMVQKISDLVKEKEQNKDLDLTKFKQLQEDNSTLQQNNFTLSAKCTKIEDDSKAAKLLSDMTLQYELLKLEKEMKTLRDEDVKFLEQQHSDEIKALKKEYQDKIGELKHNHNEELAAEKEQTQNLATKNRDLKRKLKGEQEKAGATKKPRKDVEKQNYDPCWFPEQCPKAKKDQSDKANDCRYKGYCLCTGFCSEHCSCVKHKRPCNVTCHRSHNIGQKRHNRCENVSFEGGPPDASLIAAKESERNLPGCSKHM